VRAEPFVVPRGRRARAAPQQLTKHEELRHELVRLLDSGLRPQDALPSERELTGRFGVSRTTVRHALAELEESGRIQRVHGRGTFVVAPMVRKEMTLSSFSEDMAARGLVASSRILKTRREPAGAAVGEALVMSPAERVVYVRRLRLADDEPMCLEDAYLPEGIVGDIPFQLGERSSLFQLLSEYAGIRFVKATQELKPTVLSPAEARLLAVPPFSAALHVARVSYDEQDRRVEFARSLYRGDRYSIEVNVWRR
jgi:GntR family transcriptional regulator